VPTLSAAENVETALIPLAAGLAERHRRAVLGAAGTLLDGSAAVPSTIRRNRTILHNALEYAVERRLLTRNPVKAIKWKVGCPDLSGLRILIGSSLERTGSRDREVPEILS
jgi:hypothetical protein